MICLSTKVTGTKHPHVFPYTKHGIIETGKNSLGKKNHSNNKTNIKTKQNKMNN